MLGDFHHISDSKECNEHWSNSKKEPRMMKNSENNSSEPIFILINDSIILIQVLERGSKIWDAFNPCHDDETVSTMPLRNLSLVI